MSGVHVVIKFYLRYAASYVNIIELCKSHMMHEACAENRSVFREVRIMREGIHPNYYQATVTCNCGNTFVTGSTKENIRVEICSKCHSFYTGQQKTARSDGRIDKFNKKYGVQAS